MAKFGWAYIDCADSGSDDGGAFGPTGSVQFMSGAGNTTGSVNFMYYSASGGGYTANTLVLSGTLAVSGTISASIYHVEDIALVDATGSTYFGNSDDDIHVRTGSMYVGKSNGTQIFNVELGSEQIAFAGARGLYTAIGSTGTTSSNASYIYGVTAAGNVEVRIHSAAVAQAGAVYVIKDEVTSRAGSITLSASVGSGETIDGGAFYNLAGTMPAISLYSNGTNWFVF